MHKFANKKFLYLSKWQLQRETSYEAVHETKYQLGDKYLSKEPQRNVQVVALSSEVVEVGRHMEQVGHEGHLGDGDPEAPRQKVIDESSVSFNTSKSYPGQGETPSQLM